MAPQFAELNASEREWIAKNLAATREMIVAFGDESGEPAPAILDAAFADWMSRHDFDSEDPNPVINAFGIAFGQYLADQLALEWTVATDEHGTELAVHGQPGDILIYPGNLVAKRYMDRTTGFFVSLYEQFREQIERLRTPRRWWKFW